MKTLKAMLCMAVCAAAVLMGVGKAQAQGGRGNFDPAQMRQNMLDRYKESMDVKDDAEWKLIEAAIGKVLDAQRDVMADRVRGMFGGNNRRNRGGNGGDTSSTADNGNNNNRQQRNNRFGTPSAEAEDLQKAIDDKAPADQIKTKLAALRAASADREAKLAKAQDELKALLTSRQEAVAVLGGLLK